jgi:uncharacterized membrane protein YhaH (DUF805 family)
VSFSAAISSGFRNFANFKGKASRSEFWYWVLFTALLAVVLSLMESLIWTPELPVQVSDDGLRQNFEQVVSSPSPLTTIASLVLFIPNLSMTARRFHDAGFSAKWLLLQVVPLAYGVFSTVGVVAVLSNAVPGQMLSTQELMSLVFLVIPILALFAAVYVMFFALALRPSKSFYDGNKYVDPEPLSSMDEGTTA